jgi:D-alanyl-D-alanine carboxypeptidase
MISTVEDQLVYGRALGTGEGLLSAEQQAERLDSFVSEQPPLNQPPLKDNLAYGSGLMNARGWIGHSGVLPGFSTYVFYNADLDAVVVVEVNSDIAPEDCPENNKPTLTDAPQGTPCQDPVSRINRALIEALGKPLPPPGP